MKIITTIALVLISLTALSQDYIDYEDFTFYQNGEEISLDQVKSWQKNMVLVNGNSGLQPNNIVLVQI